MIKSLVALLSYIVSGVTVLAAILCQGSFQMGCHTCSPSLVVVESGLRAGCPYPRSPSSTKHTGLRLQRTKYYYTAHEMFGLLGPVIPQVREQVPGDTCKDLDLLYL